MIQKHLMLALLWLVVICQAKANDTFCENGFEFRLLRAGDCSSLVVTGYHPIPSVDYSQPLHVPASVTHDGIKYIVERIWHDAFSGLACLQHVIIDDGISIINDNAFARCINLKSVYVPTSVEGVSPSAFAGCYSLSSLVVDTRNEYIDSRDSSNAIIDVDNDELLVACPSTRIPHSVRSIGEMAFINCTTLEELVIPEGVESIGSSAFCNCSSLKSITLPESLKKIGNNAFDRCNSLATIYIPKNVSEIGCMNIFSWCNGLSSIMVDNDNLYYRSRPENDAIVRKSDSALVATCGRTMIGDDISILDGECLYGTVVHSVNIPKTVAKVSGSAFVGCYGIDEITVAPDHPDFISPKGSNALLSKDGKTLLLGCRSTVIPDGVETIGESAFWGRYPNLVLHLPETIMKIDESAFGHCNAVDEVIIPKSVHSIGEGAFSDCVNLAVVQILSPVKTIEKFTFNNCYSLSTVSLPEGVETIGLCAFKNCKNLKHISLPKSVTKVEYWSFENCPAFEKK